jgi:hypothetical protein
MPDVFRARVVFVLAALMAPSAVLCQTPPMPSGPQIVAPGAGDCIIRVFSLDTSLPGVEVEIDVNKQPVGRQRVNDRQRLEFWIPGPLEMGDQLRSRYVTPAGRGAWSGVVEAGAADADQDCRATLPSGIPSDPRDAIAATAYVGTAIDNFAPPIIGAYEEKDERHRFIGGIDFEFRVWPHRDARRDGMQVWISGETLHGVRTADVDCSTDPKPPVCNEAITGVGQSFRFVLKRATSFEAFIQPRLELITIEPDSPFATRLYLTGRFGIAMLTEGIGYAAEAHHLGVGLGAMGGTFEGSAVEVGWGKSELFAPISGAGWNRLKFDGLLSVPFLQGLTDRARFWRTQPRFFIQLYADFDPGGNAADSVQTFIGFDVPIGDLFK